MPPGACGTVFLLTSELKKGALVIGEQQDSPWIDPRTAPSTTFARHTKNAWIVMFDGGYVLSY
jgi:hypothetical protein